LANNKNANAPQHQLAKVFSGHSQSAVDKTRAVDKEQMSMISQTSGDSMKNHPIGNPAPVALGQTGQKYMQNTIQFKNQ
jgi:hypothetical protein